MDPILPLTANAAAAATPLRPTLDLLAPAQRPAPMPACGHCQLALWLLAGANLSCHCTVLRTVVWDGVKPAVRVCDGQLLPVAVTAVKISAA